MVVAKQWVHSILKSQGSRIDILVNLKGIYSEERQDIEQETVSYHDKIDTIM